MYIYMYKHIYIHIYIYIYIYMGVFFFSAYQKVTLCQALRSLRSGPTFCYVPSGPVVFFYIVLRSPYVLLRPSLRSGPTFCYVPSGPIVFFKNSTAHKGEALRRDLAERKKKLPYIYIYIYIYIIPKKMHPPKKTES